MLFLVDGKQNTRLTNRKGTLQLHIWSNMFRVLYVYVYERDIEYRMTCT